VSKPVNAATKVMGWILGVLVFVAAIWLSYLTFEFWAIMVLIILCFAFRGGLVVFALCVVSFVIGVVVELLTFWMALVLFLMFILKKGFTRLFCLK
jgi:hypothetical protein